MSLSLESYMCPKSGAADHLTEMWVCLKSGSGDDVKMRRLNFYVLSPADHALSLKNYHKEGTGDAADQYLVLLDEV